MSAVDDEKCEKKYVKLLYDDLIHNGFQWCEGLNVDVHEFNEREECSQGGLYFVNRENFKPFLQSHTKIADVEIPPDAKVIHYDDKSKADRVILKNIQSIESGLTYLEKIGTKYFNKNEPIPTNLSTKDYIKIFKKTDVDIENLEHFDDLNIWLLFYKYSSYNKRKTMKFISNRKTQWLPFFFTKYSDSIDDIDNPTEEIMWIYTKATLKINEHSNDEMIQFVDNLRDSKMYRINVLLPRLLKKFVKEVLPDVEFSQIYGSIVRYGIEIMLKNGTFTKQDFLEFTKDHDIDITGYRKYQHIISDLRKRNIKFDYELVEAYRGHDYNIIVYIPYENNIVKLDICNNDFYCDDYTVNSNHARENNNFKIYDIEHRLIIPCPGSTSIAKQLYRCKKLLKEGYQLSNRTMFQHLFKQLEFETWTSSIRINDKTVTLTKELFENDPDIIKLKTWAFD